MQSTRPNGETDRLEGDPNMLQRPRDLLDRGGHPLHPCKTWSVNMRYTLLHRKYPLYCKTPRSVVQRGAHHPLNPCNIRRLRCEIHYISIYPLHYIMIQIILSPVVYVPDRHLLQRHMMCATPRQISAQFELIYGLSIVDSKRSYAQVRSWASQTVYVTCYPN